MTINVASLQRLNYVECIGLIFKNLDHWQWLQSGSGKPRVARQMPHAKLLKQWNTKDACTIDKLQLAVSEYTSPVQPPNKPVHDTQNSLTTKVGKWWTDSLTKKINLPTNHQVPKLLILRPTPTLQGRHSNKAHQSSSVHAVHSRGPWVAPL